MKEGHQESDHSQHSCRQLLERRAIPLCFGAMLCSSFWVREGQENCSLFSQMWLPDWLTGLKIRLCPLLGYWRHPLRGHVCNQAAHTFSCFLRCPSGCSTSIPLNFVYFLEVQVTQLTAHLGVGLKYVGVVENWRPLPAGVGLPRCRFGLWMALHVVLQLSEATVMSLRLTKELQTAGEERSCIISLHVWVVESKCFITSSLHWFECICGVLSLGQLRTPLWGFSSSDLSLAWSCT